MFGEKVPAPPLHVAELAAPPMLPARVTVGELAQTVWFEPALTVAAGSMVITISSLTAGHGPVGSSVVSVRVTTPPEISPAVGV